MRSAEIDPNRRSCSASPTDPNLRRTVRVTMVGLALALMPLAASAAIVEYALDVTVTEAGGIAAAAFPIGTMDTMLLSLDDSVTDEDPTPGSYLGTNVGGGSISSIVTVDVVTVQGASSAWSAQGDFSAFGIVNGTYDLMLIGLGLSPDQPLPDFTSLTSGTLSAVASGGVGDYAVFDITALRQIPEPSTALLVGLGLAGHAVARRSGQRNRVLGHR